MNYRDTIKKQLIESHGKVVYTYTAHWKIVNRLENRLSFIKITQIVLTALSSVGFLSAFISKIWAFNIMSSCFAALSLALNLYMLNFNLPLLIKMHTDVSNELWCIREKLASLITDFDTLNDEEIRSNRDSIMEILCQLNKKYPGTDKKSYKKAKKALKKEDEQTFEADEAERLLHRGIRE